MASIRQIRANQQNSARSTGPSEDGKLASRMNALKHGMAATEVVFEDDSERAQAKVSKWLAELKPEGPYQLYQVEQMAAAAVKIERCQNQENDWRFRQASRTDEGRNLDLSIEAERIAVGLPHHPERVARRLQQTVQGVEWLLARLRVLKESIVAPAEKENGSPLHPLSEDQRSQLLDILGVAQVLRSGRTVVDLPAGAATGTEADLAAHQAAVIDDRIAKLEHFKNVDLAVVDAIDRDASAMGRDIKIDPEIRLIRRYLKDAHRAMDRAVAELDLLQRTAKEEHAAAATSPRDTETVVEDEVSSATAEASASASPPTAGGRIPPIKSRTAVAMALAAFGAHADASREVPKVDEAALSAMSIEDVVRPSWKRRHQNQAARAAHRGFPPAEAEAES
jgi:hypothetical protein